jgi:hypothetical protein
MIILLIKIIRFIYKKYSVSQALRHFEPSIGRLIYEQFTKEKQMYNKEDKEDSYLDPILYVIEWNEQNLQNRAILKATIVNRMFKIINFIFFFVAFFFFLLHF